jgi:hypothetical protein
MQVRTIKFKIKVKSLVTEPKWYDGAILDALALQRISLLGIKI